jgi:predicted metalloendopeptidase
MGKDVFYIKIIGIIFDTQKRKILIGKNHEDESYSFLEGDLTHAEELDKCLKRTVTEKTGYIVHNLGAVYAENMLQDKEKVKIHFLCEVKSGKEKMGKNVVELKWVKPQEAEKYLGVNLPSRLHEYLINLG